MAGFFLSATLGRSGLAARPLPCLLQTSADSKLTRDWQKGILNRIYKNEYKGAYSVTRSELIAKLAAKNPAFYHRDIERLVGTILDEIGGALERGDRVELRGFGAFSVRERKARIGRNPRTGTSVEVSEKKVPFFKMGKGMRERLNR